MIALTHDHKQFEGQNIKKHHRLAFRFVVATILIFLPFATSLNSLQLVATTTVLVVLVLTVDLYGSTYINDSFWRGDQKCKYSADCMLKKKDIEEANKAGPEVKIQELAQKHVGYKNLLHSLSH